MNIMLAEISLNAVLAVIFAMLMAFVSTPIVRVIAFKIGAVDVPKDNRRMHKVPIPRLGGLAIFFSFVLTVFLFYGPSRETFAMLIGCFMIVMVGIADDIFRIRAIFKFAVQLLAALTVVFGSGGAILIEHINLFGTYYSFGYFAIPITVLWIAGLTNAVNLIDGLDGLSCGISTISAISLLFVTILNGDFRSAFLIAILTGSCMGFLPFNTNPAKIFLGDTGATFLGFVLAIVSIQGVFKVHAVITFVIPFLILGVPIFDTAFAILRRIFTGRHPFAPDRGHLHHRLIDMGFNQKQSVRILYAVSAMLGLSSTFIICGKLLFAGIIITIAISITVAMWFILRSEKTRYLTGLITEESAADKPAGQELPDEGEKENGIIEDKLGESLGK